MNLAKRRVEHPQVIDIDSSEDENKEEQEDDDEIWLTPPSHENVLSSSFRWNERKDESKAGDDVIVISSDDELESNEGGTRRYAIHCDAALVESSTDENSSDNASSSSPDCGGDVTVGHYSDDNEKRRRENMAVSPSSPSRLPSSPLSMTISSSSSSFTKKAFNDPKLTNAERRTVGKKNVYNVPDAYWRSIRDQKSNNDVNMSTTKSPDLTPERCRKYQKLLRQAMIAEGNKDFDSAEQLYLQCVQLYDADSAVVLRLLALALHNGILTLDDFEHKHLSSALSTNESRRSQSKYSEAENDVEVIVIE